MKITSSSSPRTKKILLVVAAIILAGSVGYGVYAKTNDAWPFTDNNSQTISPSSKNNTETDDDEAADKADLPTVNDKSPTNKTPAQYDKPSDNEPSPETLTGVVNFASVSGNTLTIRNTIDQQIGSGSCSLTLTHQSNGKTVTRKANILANPGSSTCEGFDVPVTELGSGSWSIKIQLSGEGKSGVIESTVKL